MKNTWKPLFMIGLLFLAACGQDASTDEEETKIVLPEPPKDLKYEAVTKIDGPLADYVEVVPGSYKFEIEKDDEGFIPGYKETMKVKLRFLKPLEVKSGTGYNHYGPSLIGKALDVAGAPLEFELSAITDDDLATYLKRGSGEEWITLTCSGQGSINSTEDANELLEKYKKGKKIRFNSEIVEEEFETAEEADDEDEESTETAAASGDCDEFLSDYEDFVDDYVDLIDEVSENPNDASLMTKYTTMMSQAATWSGKIQGCAGDPAFAGKFAAIQAEIAEAVADMQ